MLRPLAPRNMKDMGVYYQQAGIILVYSKSEGPCTQLQALGSLVGGSGLHLDLLPLHFWWLQATSLICTSGLCLHRPTPFPLQCYNQPQFYANPNLPRAPAHWDCHINSQFKLTSGRKKTPTQENSRKTAGILILHEGTVAIFYNFV